VRTRQGCVAAAAGGLKSQPQTRPASRGTRSEQKGSPRGRRHLRRRLEFAVAIACPGPTPNVSRRQLTCRASRHQNSPKFPASCARVADESGCDHRPSRSCSVEQAIAPRTHGSATARTGSGYAMWSQRKKPVPAPAMRATRELGQRPRIYQLSERCETDPRLTLTHQAKRVGAGGTRSSIARGRGGPKRDDAR